MKTSLPIFFLTLILAVSGCQKPLEVSNASSATATPTANTSQTGNNSQQGTQGNVKIGQIYLYGELHSVDWILDKEFALWHDYYHNKGMRQIS